MALCFFYCGSEYALMGQIRELIRVWNQLYTENIRFNSSLQQKKSQPWKLLHPGVIAQVQFESSEITTMEILHSRYERIWHVCRIWCTMTELITALRTFTQECESVRFTLKFKNKFCWISHPGCERIWFVCNFLILMQQN